MNLAANALGLATVLLLASAVCPQDHTVSPHISHDAPLPDLISPTVWPPAIPRTAGQPTESMPPTISVAEMRVPFAARKELMLFQRSFRSGNMQESAKHLEQAIQISPQNALAHHYLGVCYFRLSRYDKAVTEFQSASSLDEHLIQSHVSLSAVFLLQAHYTEAEAAARRALEIDRTIPEARYLLGAALAAEGRDTAETNALLRESSARYPVAHLILAQLFLNLNSTDEAIAELREYLKAPGLPEEDKQKAVSLLEKLIRSQSSPEATVELVGTPDNRHN